MMPTNLMKNRRRPSFKLALGTLRIGLAVLFAVLGFGFLLSPRVAAELARAGIDANVRMILGWSHLCGGMALLVPRLAGEAAIALSLLVAGSALYLHGEGVGIRAVVPASLATVLLTLGVCLQVRRRVAAIAWAEMLGRYADQQDALRSENA